MAHEWEAVMSTGSDAGAMMAAACGFRVRLAVLNDLRRRKFQRATADGWFMIGAPATWTVQHRAA